MFAGVSLDAGTASSSRFSANSCNHSYKSRNRFSDAETLVSLLRVGAGLDEASSDVSCGKDAEDELALERQEPVDNPGTTIGTKFSVLHGGSCAIVGELWVLTTGTLV